MRYKTEVKLFALKKRSEGITWPRVRQHVKERFNIEPPTVRAMEKWQKSLDQPAIEAEYLKDIKAQMPKIGSEAQMQVATGLLPVVLKAREAGENTENAAWMWFFQWIESWLGLEKFERLVTGYLAERKSNSGADKSKSTKGS